jgi:hypothetical protein
LSEENTGAHPFGFKQMEEEAIRMALEGRWAEAERLNLLLLEEAPADVNALNRLGKARSEQGQYEKAHASYSRALELDPYNRIARKNLEQLDELIRARKRRRDDEAAERGQVLPDFFISESGKSAILSLRAVAEPDVLHKLRRGQVVHLEAGDESVEVKTEKGKPLGRLDPRIGRRLAEFIQGGNRYVAAIVETKERGIKIFVRETHRHAQFANRLSFPPSDATRTDIVRPYFRDLGFRLREALETSIDEEALDGELDLDEDEDLLEEAPADESFEEASDQDL